MEEGPEPQEWVERAAEEHHHAGEHAAGEKRAGMMASAITAAVLAVSAAVGALLSGHAANQAIIAQTKASDQWSYFQSKSTKGHIYKVAAEIVSALSPTAGGAQAESVKTTLDRFRTESARYGREDEEIKREAEGLEAESRHEFRKHHLFALGIASFQVGIVLASVSILVRYRVLYFLSLAAGAIGLAWLIAGLLA